jgi:membrane fusion protein, multidrug efflux system
MSRLCFFDSNKGPRYRFISLRKGPLHPRHGDCKYGPDLSVIAIIAPVQSCAGGLLMTEGRALRLLLVVSAICLPVGCSSRKTTETEPVRPVKTVVVAAGNKPNVRSFPGKVEAEKSVALAFQVPGLLIKEPGKEGERVAKGQVIAQLRQDEFQAHVQAAQGQLDQARARLSGLKSGERSEEQLRRESQLRAAEAKLENAKTEFDRYARLLPSNAVSRSDYDVAQTNYHVAQEEEEAARQIVEKGSAARKEDIEAQDAVVRGLEAKLSEASVQFRDSTLRAPYNGIIAQRLVNEGQPIAPNTPVVKFQDDDEIDIVMDVPEKFMANEIRRAGSLSMVAQISGAPWQEFPVEMKEATQVADPKTQTFRVRVAMKKRPGFTALPGMTAIVNVTYWPANVSSSRILVPVSAVTKLETEKQAVWIVGPNQTVSPSPVELGSVTDGEIEILKGLQPGDRIVVAGVWSLRPGMKVSDLGDVLGGNQL